MDYDFLKCMRYMVAYRRLEAFYYYACNYVFEAQDHVFASLKVKIN